jgi:hypothetical protein
VRWVEVDWGKLIVGQLEFYWDVHLRPRLEGLTDEEYLWEPVKDCWSVRPGPDGRLVLESVWPAPEPPPVTTIAWRMVHLVAIVQYLYGLATLAVAGLAGYVAARQAELGFTDRYFEDVARNMLIAVAVVFGVTGLFAIILGRKLQRGRNWARILLNVLNLLTVASVLYADLRSLHDGRSLTGLILPVLCLILLNTRAARSWFHAHTY